MNNVNYKQEVVIHLKNLAEQRRRENKPYDAKAYDTGADIIQNMNVPINSQTSFEGIRGIGTRIKEQINLVVTGAIKIETDTIENEKISILESFKQIYSVGNDTAEYWYNLGYRNIDQIPNELMTERQIVSRSLYKEYTQPIPRAEIDILNTEFQRYFQGSPITFTIAGSYRRGKEFCNDIDVIICNSDSTDSKEVLKRISSHPWFKYELGCGPTKYLGLIVIDTLHRRIDLEYTIPERYPFALLYFTGSANFNREMRARAASMNLRLNQMAITDAQGNSFLFNEEKDIFSFLRMPYLEPKQR